MFRRSLCVAVAASIIVAAPAGAATLTSTSDGLRFTAAPGADNFVTVSGNSNPPSTLTIDTPADPIAYSVAAPLPAGCQDTDTDAAESPASSVECTNVSVRVTFDLGDLGDDFRNTGTLSNITVLGGPGLDHLQGGAGAQTIDGGAEEDRIIGGAGDDELRGGDGDELVEGGEGDDRLFGDAGSDRLVGGSGNDVSFGGTGDDQFYGDPGADIVRGEDGTDSVFDNGDEGADDYDGGAGHDQLYHDADLFITVDLAAGTVNSETESEVATGFEDLILEADTTTMLGTSATNLIIGYAGADTVDGRGGADVVLTGDNDDTIEARDGFADRVSCGAGNDTVQADTLDDVANDCENVTRTNVGNANDAPDVPEDKAPTVAIGAPSSAAVLSTVSPNTITATATDDVGIARVIFSTGERILCTDTTAPYSCDYNPTSADVGRDTLVVIAVDTAGQTASAVRVVNVPRFKASSLSASTTPKRDRKAPFTFTTKGKLALPPAVASAAGCKGTVDVSFKAGKKTVSSRRVALKADCTYSSKVTFRLPRRLNPKTLSVVVVYGGNEVVEGVQAKRHAVRPR